MYIIYIIAGIIFLYFGAEWLVKGSSRLALAMGIPSLIVGLTVVAFGTSAPEMVVSVSSGLKGIGGIAIGNVVGSNIFNIAVILGIAAIISPLKVNIQVLRIDAPIMMAATLIVCLVLLDGTLSRMEGAFLFAGIICYVVFSIYFGRKNNNNENNDVLIPSKAKNPGKDWLSMLLNAAFIFGGLILLVAGSKLFVKGAVDIAHILNISETIIGLTIVSAGTSLPELATSVLAAFRREEDIAIGNVIGSNIFNIFAILGFTGLLTPITFSGIGIVDMLVLIGTAVLILPVMRSGFRINRAEGVFLLLTYCGYLTYLIF